MTATSTTLVHKSSSIATVLCLPPFYVVVVVVAYFIQAHAQGSTGRHVSVVHFLPPVYIPTALCANDDDYLVIYWVLCDLSAPRTHNALHQVLYVPVVVRCIPLLSVTIISHTVSIKTGRAMGPWPFFWSSPF